MHSNKIMEQTPLIADSIVCVYACMHACVHVCMYESFHTTPYSEDKYYEVNTYIYIYINIYIYIYIFIMHTSPLCTSYEHFPQGTVDKHGQHVAPGGS